MALPILSRELDVTCHRTTLSIGAAVCVTSDFETILAGIQLGTEIPLIAIALMTGIQELLSLTFPESFRTVAG